jgi:membrane fusion protein (multidrug efflux system)
MYDRARTGPVSVLLPLLLVACSKEAPPPAAPPPAQVIVVRAAKKDVPVFLESVAQTVAQDTVDIKARVAGVLLTQTFEEGKEVKKGAVLFTIDPREYEAALLGAKARLAKAEADLKLAKEQVTVRTAEALVAQARAKMKKAQTDVAREQVGVLLATAEVEGAKAAVADAELNLSYCTISAPMDGLIGRSMVSVGNLVGRGESTVLATLSTISPMHASFTISEQEYMRLRAKDAENEPPPFHLTLADGTAYPDAGKYVVAEREVDTRTGTLVIEAAFPNGKGLLRPGQFGRVKVVAETIKDAVVVPRKAVMEQQSAKTVYVVDGEKKVVLRTVELGERYEDVVVVRKGVEAGDTVIVDGMMKTRPGLVVVPTEGKKEGKAAEGEGK